MVRVDLDIRVANERTQNENCRKAGCPRLIDSIIFQIETMNPIALMAAGAAMLALVAVLFLTGGPSETGQ